MSHALVTTHVHRTCFLADEPEIRSHRQLRKLSRVKGQGGDATELTAVAVTRIKRANALKTMRQTFGLLIGSFDSPWLAAK
jgi:hypothetical protein